MPLSDKKMLEPSLGQVIEAIQKEFGYSDDLQVRKVFIGQDEATQCALVSIDGLANLQSINDLVNSLVFNLDTAKKFREPDSYWSQIAQVGGTTTEIKDYESLYYAILSGQTVFLVDRHTTAYAIATEGWETRGIDESKSESVIRGPREGFTETLRTNTALIRRRVKDPKLRMRSKKVGSVTRTYVSLAYIEGIVNENSLAEIERRLEDIDIDAVLESGYIEELIRDKKWTLFPMVYSTERPDVVAAGILEGRIAIIVDGTPFVILAPALFVQFFQAAEDYYLPPIYSMITRGLRYVSFILMLFATSLYIVATTYHPELLPTELLISFSVQREDVPFPIYVEALLIMFTYEILREAIIRMPKAVGSAVSIVGALVLGDAAIKAGFVSNALVIVIALEAVVSFILPTSISTPVRLLRFGVVTMTACFGLVGLFVSMMLILIHLCSLQSFGVPYMSPFTPFNLSDQKDNFLRFPLLDMFTRPSAISGRNKYRREGRSDKE